MKLVTLLAGLLLSMPIAHAESEDQILDLEPGAMSQEASSALTSPTMELNRARGDRGAEMARDLIGVIGAIAADRIEDEMRGPGRGPGRPGRPGDGWDRDYVCYARDGRGNLYRAVGPNARRVQQRAMAKCYRYARFCRAEGCHVL